MITNNGSVIRPKVGEENENVTLTATITKENYSATKILKAVVLAETASGLVAYYLFDDNLGTVLMELLQGIIQGDDIMNRLKRQKTLPLKNVEINDGFWSRYISLIRDVVIPYQWEILNDNLEDVEPSHAIRNFRIAAGEEEGEFYGMVFQDSDVAKWLEAVAYSLETHPNPKLEKLADETIDLIGRAQLEDGYLNTYYIINGIDKRWTNLQECHELYCAGHMIEAGVAYYKATGKRKLLDIVCRFADHIDTVFGPEPSKKKGYPGHQEIELALFKLYEVTGEEKYLNLAKFFIDERGKEPYYFDIEWEERGKTEHFHGMRDLGRQYAQAHLPVRQQTKAVGHAVRAVYMYTAMADIASETEDKELLKACKILWDNIVTKQMYITGGIGSMAHGEAFSYDYDLPNDTAYAETCAAIGLIFFAWRMLKIEPNRCYADVIEKALYNNVLAGMSLDGKRFFYVNPLEVVPEACEKNGTKMHVKPTRQKWFPCACCPPNLSRLIASLGQYIYTHQGDTLYIHQYIDNKSSMEFCGGNMCVTQKTDYPWDEKIDIELALQGEKEFTLALRIPEWCKNPQIYINGQIVEIGDNTKNGYATLNRIWKDGDKIQLILPMEVLRIRSNPAVRENIGRVALQYGPIIYCLEEVDNGPDLHEVKLPLDVEFEAKFDEDLLGGVNIIEVEGERVDGKWPDEFLYSSDIDITYNTSKLTFIPYYAWDNRGMGEMLVWVREGEK